MLYLNGPTNHILKCYRNPPRVLNKFRTALKKQIRFLCTALDEVLSLSCVVGVLLNNSHKVFVSYLNGQSNLVEIAPTPVLLVPRQVS